MDGSVVFARLRQHALCTPPNTCFVWSTWVHNPNGISIGSAIFAQFMAECHQAWPKNCPLTCGKLDPHLTHGSLVPVHMPKGISIDSAIPVRPPNMDGSIVFPRLCYCAPACNTCFLRHRWVHNPSSISIGSVIFAHLMAECCRACCMLGRVLSHKNCALTCGDLDPSTTCFLGLTRVHISNSTSIGSAVFAQLTAECFYSL